jgi:hypothetical protein
MDQRRHVKPTRAGGPGLLRSLAWLLCSRCGFEQLAPYVEERPSDEHDSPKQDESGHHGHGDRYTGKPRDEAPSLTVMAAS